MTERPKLLWCKWWLADWLSSETRYSMTAAERGVYRDALDLCYSEGSIPADEQTLGRLLAVNPEEFASTWPKVSRKFQPHPDLPERLINRRAAEVIAEEETFRRRQSEFGKCGGRPKKANQKGSLSPEKGFEKGSLSKTPVFQKGLESQQSRAEQSR